MKRFKLLKDLPGIDAGTILYLDGRYNSNELLIENDTDSIEYSGFLLCEDGTFGSTGGYVDSSASDWLEELPNEYKRWRTCPSNPYYYVDDEGDVSFRIEGNILLVSDKNYAIGNYFQTKDEAQAYADYLKALAVVRDDAKGFVPNWEEESRKWYVTAYHREDGSCVIGSGFWFRTQDNGVFSLPYFETEDDAEASIKKHEKEWKIIFGIKDNDEEE